VSDRVADELGGLAHAELAHQARTVRLDRLRADPELRADLLRGVALGDQAEDLALAPKLQAAAPRGSPTSAARSAIGALKWWPPTATRGSHRRSPRRASSWA
jgi:hypothetical protein